MGTFNAKLSDLDKKFSKEVSRLDKMDESDNAISVRIRTDVTKEIAEVWAAVKQLQTEVGKLSNQVGKLGG